MQTSPDLCRIVNEKKFHRLQGLLDTAENVPIGGKSVPSDLFIEPTIVVDVKATDPIMQEEIFGPIMPIVNVRNASEAIEFINKGESPLALYVFTEDKHIQEAFISKVPAGGVCINDTFLHAAVPNLKYGGVGNSGIGQQHAKYSFDTFVRKKSVLIKKCNKSESLATGRYPPYTEEKTKRLLRLMTSNETSCSQICRYFLGTVFILLGVISIALVLGYAVSLLVEEVFDLDDEED